MCHFFLQTEVKLHVILLSFNMFFLISDYKDNIYSVVGVSTEAFTHMYCIYSIC